MYLSEKTKTCNKQDKVTTDNYLKEDKTQYCTISGLFLKVILDASSTIRFKS